MSTLYRIDTHIANTFWIEAADMGKAWEAAQELAGDMLEAEHLAPHVEVTHLPHALLPANAEVYVDDPEFGGWLSGEEYATTHASVPAA